MVWTSSIESTNHITVDENKSGGVTMWSYLMTIVVLEPGHQFLSLSSPPVYIS